MHLHTVHSSRYYSAQPETGVAIHSAIDALARRQDYGYSSPSWTNIFIAAGACNVGAIMLGFIFQLIYSQIKRRNNFKEKQQRWYGQ